MARRKGLTRRAFKVQQRNAQSEANGGAIESTSKPATSTEPERRSIGEKITHQWLASFLVALAAIIAAVTAVTGTAQHAWKLVFAPSWPETEYSKLDKIHLGLNLGTAVAVFGSPVSSQNMPQDKETQNVYIERGYWMQLFTDKDNTIVQWTVLPCDPRFQPRLPVPQSATSGGKVQLNVSTFGEVGLGRSIWYNQPATNTGTYSETFGGSHADGWVSYLLGADFSCSPEHLPGLDNLYGLECTDPADPETGGCNPAVPAGLITQFRSNIKINAWTECIGTCQEFPGSLGAGDLPLPFSTRSG